MTDAQIEKLIDAYESAFPLPFILMVIGYAFILLIDRVLIDSHQSAGDALKQAEEAILEAESQESDDNQDISPFRNDGHGLGRGNMRNRGVSRSMAGGLRPATINFEDDEMGANMIDQDMEDQLYR